MIQKYLSCRADAEVIHVTAPLLDRFLSHRLQKERLPALAFENLQPTLMPATGVQRAAVDDGDLSLLGQGVKLLREWAL